MESRFCCSPAFTMPARKKLRATTPTPGPADYSPIKEITHHPSPIFGKTSPYSFSKHHSRSPLQGLSSTFSCKQMKDQKNGKKVDLNRSTTQSTYVYFSKLANSRWAKGSTNPELTNGKGKSRLTFRDSCAPGPGSYNICGLMGKGPSFRKF